MKEERFEQFLKEALACDVQPGDDFTARVMDRIAATPQELPKKRGADKKTLRRMMTALVACAAIVIVIPLGMLMMPKGNAAKAADCAMQEAVTESAKEDCADMEMFTADDAALDHSRNEVAETEAADDAPTDGGAATPTYNEAPEEQMDQMKANAALILSGDEAAVVQAILTEENIAPIFTDETQQRYLLTAEQTAQLHELVPELVDMEGVLELTLEVAQ